MSPKRKRRDDGEEEDDDEANVRWADMWISSCVVEPDEDRMFRSAIKDISFLSQIGVSFNFSSVSNLEDDLRRNEEERISTLPTRSTFRMVSGGAYEPGGMIVNYLGRCLA